MNPEQLKIIRVVAAVIRKGDSIFATQRGYGKMIKKTTANGAVVVGVPTELCSHGESKDPVRPNDCAAASPCDTGVVCDWEFPGGKIEPGESPQEALVREIREELDAEIRVGELIKTIEYSYPTFHLSMDVFWCELASDHLTLLEHESARWLTRDTLRSVQWLPADLELIDLIKEKL